MQSEDSSTLREQEEGRGDQIRPPAGKQITVIKAEIYNFMDVSIFHQLETFTYYPSMVEWPAS
jgi:hypothetical protein